MSGAGRVGMVLGLAAAVLATGCAHGKAATVNEKPEPPSPFTLGRGDVVEVSVYREPELSRTLPVRPDGRITLPVAGEIEAAGRTPEQLRDQVLERLGSYVQDPSVVTVIVREVNSARFYVMGEVTRPGDYALRPGMTVLHALALAGGLGEFSARSHVTVVRAGGARVLLDVDDVLAGRSSAVLRAGDTLVVP